LPEYAAKVRTLAGAMGERTAKRERDADEDGVIRRELADATKENARLAKDGAAERRDSGIGRPTEPPADRHARLR